MENITALQEIREEKKRIEEEFNRLVREFEEKYSGFEIESVSVSRLELRNHCHSSPKLTLNIKIPWL